MIDTSLPGCVTIPGCVCIPGECYGRDCDRSACRALHYGHGSVGRCPANPDPPVSADWCQWRSRAGLWCSLLDNHAGHHAPTPNRAEDLYAAATADVVDATIYCGFTFPDWRGCALPDGHPGGHDPVWL